ncbi:hypothetical protein P3T39_000774 [Kitasatospora sp. GP82]|nr:hypothetical protein [Kitasatospora sp. GP82]MDH6576062.1 hypothetical protein [Kitasatospora sp. MAP5-34]
MHGRITATSATALGDVQKLKQGDVLHVQRGAETRRDFDRYWDAMRTAWWRGAEIHWED